MSANTQHVAVIGDETFARIFRMVGADVYPAKSVDEAKETLFEIFKEHAGVYGVIYILDDIYPTFSESEKVLSKAHFASCVVAALPGPAGGASHTDETFRELCRQAIGSDIVT